MNTHSMEIISRDGAPGYLSIDLGALRQNYRSLCARTAPVPVAAVVKANAYGLDVARVAPVLHDAGCRDFFVAHVGEAHRLWRYVDGARIFVLNGHGGNTEALRTIVTELTVKHRLPLATGTYWDIAAEPIKALLDRQTALLHACEAETSMIMALAPELVDPEILSQMHGPYVTGLSAIPGVNPGVYRWRQLSSRSPNGVIGDAGAASAEKGKRLLEAIARAVADALLEEKMWSEPI